MKCYIKKTLISIFFLLPISVNAAEYSVSFNNPPGSILTYAGSVCPSGYLEADGSQVSRADNSALFLAIGINHGSGDGSTTFHLPDYRGRFLRGVDKTAGRDEDKATRSAMNAGGNSGNLVGSVQADAIQNITGKVNNESITWTIDGDTASGVFQFQNTGGGYARGYSASHTFRHKTLSFDASRVARTSVETRPENAYVLYCVKR